MSALPPKADICGAARDVCYGPIADIVEYLIAGRCPLYTQKADIAVVSSKKKPPIEASTPYCGIPSTMNERASVVLFRIALTSFM